MIKFTCKSLVTFRWLPRPGDGDVGIGQQIWASLSGNSYGHFNRYAKLRVAHAPGMPGTFSPNQPQRKPLVSDPGMHHGTCVTHVPWCMSGKTFPVHAQPAILRIWKEAHGWQSVLLFISFSFWNLFWESFVFGKVWKCRIWILGKGRCR